MRLAGSSTGGLEPVPPRSVVEPADPLHLNRRAFLKTVGLGASAALAGSLLEACSSKASSAKPSKSKPTTKPSSTRPVAIAQVAEPISLDPIKFVNYVTITSLTVQSLYQWSSDRSVAPLLASALPTVSSDGLHYRIPLRDGVTFSDGSPFGAEDVKFTFDTILDPKTGSEWLAAIGALEDVSVIDSRTVQLDLKFPYSPILYELAYLPVLSSKKGYGPDTYARSLFGTGPYVFESWEQGVAIRFRRNDRYFVSGTPRNIGVDFPIVSSVATQVTDLVDGEIDILPNLPPSYVDTLRARQVSVYVGTHPVEQYFIIPNLANGHATANVALRQAIAWAIDREAIIKSVFDGTAVPGAALPGAGELFASPKYVSYFGTRANASRARSYLAQAKGAPSAPLDFVVQDTPKVKAAATIVQENLATIGIKTSLRALSTTAYFPLLERGEYDLLMLDTTAGFSPASAYLALYPTSPLNFNHYANPQIKTLLDQAVAAGTGPAANRAWEKVQKLFVADLPQIIVAVARYLEADNKRLQGYKPSPLGYFLDVANATTLS
jgi:peptide/nickel transport system substrate-binding protein